MSPSEEDQALLRILGALRVRVREQPFQTLGLTALIGLAVGAGLWRRAGLSLLRTGAQIALATVVPAMIEQQTGAAGDNGTKEKSHA